MSLLDVAMALRHLHGHNLIHHGARVVQRRTRKTRGLASVELLLGSDLGRGAC